MTPQEILDLAEIDKTVQAWKVNREAIGEKMAGMIASTLLMLIYEKNIDIVKMKAAAEMVRQTIDKMSTDN